MDGFARTGKGLWFRDLYTMGKLCNENISDNEQNKTVKVASKEISHISLDGRKFKVAPGTKFDISYTSPRCHVLCLSDKENCPELFELFKADICIAINVVEMVKMIKAANHRYGVEVVADSVKYYKNSHQLLSSSPVELAFLKPEYPYQRESEYRIAMFWPSGEDAKIRSTDAGYINIFGEIPAENDHITLNFQCAEFSQIVVGVKRI